MQRAVVEHKAHLGLALDGDADRLMVADETGALLDGDQLMALIATSWHRAGTLQGGGIVATVMSNLGLERYLGGLGLNLARTAVGDRYVVEHMREHGYNIGGEQSGHIILQDHSTTGDGLIAALQVLAALIEQGGTASEVGRVFMPLPQRMTSVRFAAGRDVMKLPIVERAIAEAETRLNGTGRLLIRKSGPSRSSASWPRPRMSGWFRRWSKSWRRPSPRRRLEPRPHPDLRRLGFGRRGPVSRPISRR